MESGLTENPRQNVTTVFAFWRKGKPKKIGPVSTDGEVFYSYSQPLAVRRGQRVFVIDKGGAGSTVTTAQHLSGLRQLLIPHRMGGDADLEVHDVSAEEVRRAAASAEAFEELVVEKEDVPRGTFTRNAGELTPNWGERGALENIFLQQEDNGWHVEAQFERETINYGPFDTKERGMEMREAVIESALQRNPDISIEEAADRLREWLEDPDPAAMDVAEDWLLQNQISLTKVAEYYAKTGPENLDDPMGTGGWADDAKAAGEIVLTSSRDPKSAEFSSVSYAIWQRKSREVEVYVNYRGEGLRPFIFTWSSFRVARVRAVLEMWRVAKIVKRQLQLNAGTVETAEAIAGKAVKLPPRAIANPDTSEDLMRNPPPKTYGDFDRIIDALVAWEKQEPYDRALLAPLFRRMPAANAINADRRFWLGELLGDVDRMVDANRSLGVAERQALERRIEWLANESPLPPQRWQKRHPGAEQLARATRHEAAVAAVSGVGGARAPHEILRRRVRMKHRAEDPQENPPWVTKILAKSMAELEAKVPPQWLPKLEHVRHVKGPTISGRLREYGCGAYGCVLPTLDDTIVLKLTSDSSEAKFASELAETLPVPIVTQYFMVMQIEGAERKGRHVYLLWREAADHVGKIDKVVGPHAEDAIEEQHELAKSAFIAVVHGKLDDFKSAVTSWKQATQKMAQIPELAFVAQGLLRAYDEAGVFISDVHGGNLGLVTRNGSPTWVITDPGNVVVLGEGPEGKHTVPTLNPQVPRPGVQRFFEEHAGFGYHPDLETRVQGRRRSARELAIAEYVLEHEHPEVEVVWDGDDCSHLADEEYEECLHVQLRDEDGDVLAQLGGITDPTREYERVIVAELAYEAFRDRVDELAQQLHQRRGRPLRLNPAYDARIDPWLGSQIIRSVVDSGWSASRQAIMYDVRHISGSSAIDLYLGYFQAMGLIEMHPSSSVVKLTDKAIADMMPTGPSPHLWPHPVSMRELVSGYMAPDERIARDVNDAFEELLMSESLRRYVLSFQAHEGAGWTASYEFPGHFEIKHPAGAYSLLINYEARMDSSWPSIDIQIANVSEGRTLDDGIAARAFPYSGPEFMALIQPFMDKYHP